MIELKCHYKSIFKGHLKCKVCKSENYTTEYLLKCTSNVPIQYNTANFNKLHINVVKIIEENLSQRESLEYKVGVCMVG